MKIRNSPFLQMFYSMKNMKLSELFSEDISYPEYVMLQLITEMANETGSMDVWVADLVKRVEVTPQAVSKFVNLAVDKGYLERFENESDRRSIGVRMTDTGKAVLSKAGEELSTFYKGVLEEFSEEELATMNGLMHKLQNATQVNYAKYRKK